MVSNPAKPGFRLKSLWNSVLKEEIYSGEVDFESVRAELEDYGGKAILNDGKSSYGSPPKIPGEGDLNSYLENIASYPDIKGYGELFSDGREYEVFVSLIPGKKNEEGMEWVESEQIKIEWKTSEEPDI